MGQPAGPPATIRRVLPPHPPPAAPLDLPRLVMRRAGLVGLLVLLLAVVLGLLFLVGFQRRLLWTITAFTAAHSLTLGLSALGWLTLRPPPASPADLSRPSSRPCTSH